MIICRILQVCEMSEDAQDDHIYRKMIIFGERLTRSLPKKACATGKGKETPLEKLTKVSDDEVRLLGRIDADEVWKNDLYHVAVLRNAGKFEGRTVIQLSIKRRDREAISPEWRDKQEIKNQLVGPEYEGVELYPAESRLNDQVNKYHLWVVDDANFRFLLGWRGRATLEDDAKGELEE
jgi:hypothetical protein